MNKGDLVRLINDVLQVISCFNVVLNHCLTTSQYPHKYEVVEFCMASHLQGYLEYINDPEALLWMLAQVGGVYVC